MPITLNDEEQARLLGALPEHRYDAAIEKLMPKLTKMAEKKGTLSKRQLEGKGFLSSVGKALGFIGKEVGLPILKQVVLPMVVKKLTGKGLVVAEGKGILVPGESLSSGNGLRVAGQRGKVKKTK